MNEPRRGPGRPPKLAGQEQAVIESYLAGATLGEVADQFGVGDGPVIRILDEAGIERRRGRPSRRSGETRTAPSRAEHPHREVSRPRREKPAPPAARVAQESVKAEVLSRDGYRCRSCGTRDRLTVEYVVPPKKGGSALRASDLRTICFGCLTAPVEDAQPARRGILRRLLSRA